jgi:2-polyprenyl-3-methyl-5-hydroxy-6-metoxy-1,4-benzoquinol methylase
MADQNFNLKSHSKYGFLQISPTPSPEEISKFYANEFYSGDYKKLNDSSLEVQTEDAEFYNGRWDDICANIKEITKRELKDLKVLDIGCGWGQALFYFKKQGMDCYGFDPAPEAVAYGKERGLNIVTSGFDNMNVFSQRFDVVSLLNVLEHLSDPVKVIAEIREKVLKPGGLLILDVPNEFNDFQVAGQTVHHLEQWWVAPPAHLNYFSGTTLSGLLTGEGYKVQALESSFPLEMFLLFGRNYVKDPVLGKKCHNERVAFETNLRLTGKTDVLRKFYRNLAELNLGRQVLAYATS